MDRWKDLHVAAAVLAAGMYAMAAAQNSYAGGDFGAWRRTLKVEIRFRCRGVAAYPPVEFLFNDRPR